MDYKDLIENLNAKLGISEDEIYDFHGKPGEEDYLTHFEFFQEALFRHSNYGISPSYFYFRNNRDNDARAKKKNNIYLIGINKGLVEFLDRRYLSYFDLKDFDELGKYQELEILISNSIGFLMYQASMLFTFYHELGHLIQFVEKEEIELEESLNKNSSYSIQLHSEELDADIFSSICLSTHIYQYVAKLDNASISVEIITNLVSVLTSSIFLYFLSFTEYREGFYLREKSHPHPFVRIVSAFSRIIDYFELLLNNKGLNIKISQPQVFEETFRVSEIFTRKIFSDSEFQGFTTTWRESYDVILIYYNELTSIIDKSPNFAINRRNEMITKPKHSI